MRHSDKRTGELYVIEAHRSYITGVWLNMVNLLQMMTVSMAMMIESKNLVATVGQSGHTNP